AVRASRGTASERGTWPDLRGEGIVRWPKLHPGSRQPLEVLFTVDPNGILAEDDITDGQFAGRLLQRQAHGKPLGSLPRLFFDNLVFAQLLARLPFGIDNINLRRPRINLPRGSAVLPRGQGRLQGLARRALG